MASRAECPHDDGRLTLDAEVGPDGMLTGNASVICESCESVVSGPAMSSDRVKEAIDRVWRLRQRYLGKKRPIAS